MRNTFSGVLLVIGMVLIMPLQKLVAQKPHINDSLNVHNTFTEKVKISGVFYLASNYRKSPDADCYAFLIRRAYLTVMADLTKNLSVRYTQDITIDMEGNDAGNVELRIKYAYMQYKFSDFLFFTNNHIRFGITQRPWFDYEEHINAYRVSGTMFFERSGLFNSSGFGLSYEGFFGGKLSGEYTKRVNAHYPGKYGTFSIGVFNGGGYHNFEKNTNKTFEARISIRPMPSLLPGLQFTYMGIYGKENIPESADFIFNAGYVSYESKLLTVTAQYETGLGNSTGVYVDSSFNALPHHGYSLYGEFRIPKTTLALYGRYDNFTLQADETSYSKRYITGASWRFFKQNKIVLTYQNETVFNKPDIQIVDLALDISF